MQDRLHRWYGLTIVSTALAVGLVLFAACTSKPSSSIPSNNQSTQTTSLSQPTAAPSTTLPPTAAPTTLLSSATTTTAARNIELGHDAGIPASSLALGSVGYAVKFAPDCPLFVIKEVSIYGSLYGQNNTDKSCELKILDGNQTVITETSFPWTAFSSQAKWIHVAIGTTRVSSPFYIMLYTNSRPTEGVNIFYDSIVSNQGSDIMDNWRVVDWAGKVKQPEKARCNWMLRVTGAAADASLTITQPFPVKIDSWKTVSFKDAVAALDTPEKVSASLLMNMTAESHYSTDPSAPFSILTPEKVYEAGRGACNEFAIFACHVLQQHGFDARILIIKVESNPARNHSVCVFTVNNQVWTINNGNLMGPFADYKGIALKHDALWSSYQVYNTWQKFQVLGAPDSIVKRS